MAPEATIVFVATDFELDHIVDGMNYIKQKAQALGMPWVLMSGRQSVNV